VADKEVVEMFIPSVIEGVTLLSTRSVSDARYLVHSTELCHKQMMYGPYE
jgi:hypothetical protein